MTKLERKQCIAIIVFAIDQLSNLIAQGPDDTKYWEKKMSDTRRALEILINEKPSGKKPRAKNPISYKPVQK